MSLSIIFVIEDSGYILAAFAEASLILPGASSFSRTHVVLSFSLVQPLNFSIPDQNHSRANDIDTSRTYPECSPRKGLLQRSDLDHYIFKLFTVFSFLVLLSLYYCNTDSQLQHLISSTSANIVDTDLYLAEPSPVLKHRSTRLL